MHRSPPGVPGRAGPEEPRPAAPLGEVAAAFLRVGLTAYGGLGAAMAVLERELVQRRGLATADELAEAWASSRLLPGSGVVHVVSFLGHRRAGWPGSLVATLAFLAPSVVAMLALALLYDQVSSRPAGGAALSGLTAAIAGLLLGTTYRLARSTLTGPVAAALAVGGAGLVGLAGVPVFLVMLGAGAVGALALGGTRLPPP
jgi:chromate transporter